MGQKIPYELSDCIIDNLRDDLGTLKQCSLVCRSWLPSSRLHIHRQIDWSIWDDKACARKFRNMHQFLLHSPHIAFYIKEISLAFRELSWRTLASDEFALRSLKLLPALTCIRMARMTWKTAEDLDSFLDSCNMEFVTTLELDSCRFPTLPSLDAFLGALPHLTSLHLNNPQFCNHRDPPRIKDTPRSTQGRIYLRSLTSSITLLHDWFLCPFTMLSIEALRSLSLEHMRRPDFGKMQELLRQASGSIEEVTLKVIGVGAGALPTIDVTNVHRLRLCDGSPKLSMCGQPPQWILELLVQLRSVEDLEEIEVVVVLSGMTGPVRASDGWTRLDDILADPKFRSIRRFSVSCTGQPSRPTTDVRGYLEAAVGRGMPKLNDRACFQTSSYPSIIWDIAH